jgi:transposase-like protein
MEKERKRRKFSEEYKAETVRLIQRSGKSIGQMALELGIGETALRRGGWSKLRSRPAEDPPARSSAASAKSWQSFGARTSGCGWSAKS